MREVDVPTLRRIALLTLRVSQDDPALRTSMIEVSTILDHMKRDVALGRTFAPSDLKRLRTLLTGVARPRAPQSLIEAAMLDELRDLGSVLTAD
ncbi:MAG TPA: hypothetical protein VFT12_10735 [Thermoanaerobaculia bacterium]|nr:hypothetical protein [Thermoanaerobaculia bacterium]